jgi:hypothetical protein
MTEHFTKALDQCQATLNRCVSSCSGCIDEHCDTVQRTCDKCNRKVDDYLVGQLATLYNRLARFGVSLPTDQELQGAATGGGRPLAPLPEPGGSIPQPSMMGDMGPAAGLPLNPPESAIPTPYSPPALPTRPTPTPEPAGSSSRPYAGSQTAYSPIGGTNPPAATRKKPGDCLEVDLCDDLYAWFRFWGNQAQPFFATWWNGWLWWNTSVNGKPVDPDEPPKQPDWQWIVPTYEAEKEVG